MQKCLQSIPTPPPNHFPQTVARRARSVTSCCCCCCRCCKFIVLWKQGKKRNEGNIKASKETAEAACCNPDRRNKSVKKLMMMIPAYFLHSFLRNIHRARRVGIVEEHSYIIYIRPYIDIFSGVYTSMIQVSTGLASTG